MRHFLVVFDRRTSKLVRFDEFPAAKEALKARFAAEAARSADRRLEIVVLSGVSEAAVKRTHRSYFEKVGDMTANALVKWPASKSSASKDAAGKSFAIKSSARKSSIGKGSVVRAGKRRKDSGFKNPTAGLSS